MAFTFPAMVAWDPNGKQAVKNVSFQVYATTDTAFTTPLPITDPFGTALPGNILNSGSQGVFPQFQAPAPNSTVVIEDSTKTYAWTVVCATQDSAVANFINNGSSATTAALNATYATIAGAQASAQTQILADADGVPYYQPPAFALDTDGTPYYDANGVPTASAIGIFTDTDAVPYFA